MQAASGHDTLTSKCQPEAAFDPQLAARHCHDRLPRLHAFLSIAFKISSPVVLHDALPELLGFC